MNSQTLAAQFEVNRPHLRAVATRLLGSPTEADDAVQEAWLRFDRAGDEGIVNLGGWLTTVVSRICLDHLRSRTSRAEEPDDAMGLQPDEHEPGPEDAAILRESTADALAVVLNTLTPIERVAFVLHDVFDMPFDEIAAIVDRSPAATRQLASRARRRVRAANPAPLERAERHREIVSAFMVASRDGQLSRLIELLAPGVVLRSDRAAVAMGSHREVVGATAVADVSNGRAQAARMATIDGAPGLIWAPGGKPRMIFRFTIDGDSIGAIDLVADPEVIAGMTIVPEPAVVRRRAKERLPAEG